jgi:mannose-6-phosphate isomerase-like protein (cupin superfamily)
MTVRNWRSAKVTSYASALFNNPRRVVSWLMETPEGKWVDRRVASSPPAQGWIVDHSLPPEANCLRTAQFVHHARLPRGGTQAPEMHQHPDAEEIFYIISGSGEFRLGDETHVVQSGDAIYVAPGVPHRLTNPNDEPLEFLDVNVPVGEALRKLLDRP